MAALMALCIRSEDYNHPLVSGEKVASSGKPSSREPGKTQADWLTRAVERKLIKAIKEIEGDFARAMENGIAEQMKRERGIEKPKRKVSIEVRQQRVVARLMTEEEA